MPYLVRLTDRALRDMEAIYEFIRADTSEAALTWFNDLAERIYSLEGSPQRGRTHSRTGKLREILFGQKSGIYKIIFAVDKRRRVVNVLHIRHAARAPLGNFIDS